MSWFRRKKKPDPILLLLESISCTLDFIFDEMIRIESNTEAMEAEAEEINLELEQESVRDDLKWFDLSTLTKPVPLADTMLKRACSICGELGRNARTCRPGFGHMSESEWRHLTETE